METITKPNPATFVYGPVNDTTPDTSNKVTVTLTVSQSSGATDPDEYLVEYTNDIVGKSDWIGIYAEDNIGESPITYVDVDDMTDGKYTFKKMTPAAGALAAYVAWDYNTKAWKQVAVTPGLPNGNKKTSETGSSQD